MVKNPPPKFPEGKLKKNRQVRKKIIRIISLFKYLKTFKVSLIIFYLKVE